MAEYQVPEAEQISEIEIKRSRFICYLARAENREQAQTYISQVRAQHPQARHVCWAYIAGPPGTTVLSMSDDGEPSGTAGRPMLAALQYSGVVEVVAAVVRYFGGIKLGTGGLQRAYSDSVVAALQACPMVACQPMELCRIEFPFADEAAVRRLLEELAVSLVAVEYGQSVAMKVAVPAVDSTLFGERLTTITAGRAQLKALE
ncbi:YigZ family protein [Halioxenophilus sp. WMMB6]|uniref:YigZ family protein n=1 Tax=Halioxenophilus sp. WMMB6 TaxID=3073815 RepID=UPI00295EA21F|nr:YigZ family protein [Halioxenophilus sp. WMMB6]